MGDCHSWQWTLRKYAMYTGLLSTVFIHFFFQILLPNNSEIGACIMEITYRYMAWHGGYFPWFLCPQVWQLCIADLPFAQEEGGLSQQASCSPSFGVLGVVNWWFLKRTKDSKKTVEDVQQTHAHTRTCTDLENDIRKLCIGSCSQLVNVSKLSPLGLVRHPTTINYRPLETLTGSNIYNIWYIYMQHRIFQTHLYLFLKKDNIIWHEGKNGMIFPWEGPGHFPSIPSSSFARGHACQDGRGFGGVTGWVVNWLVGFGFEMLHVCTLT